MSAPLLVIADSYRLAVDYAHDHDLGPEHPQRWLYVADDQRIRGRRGPGQFVVVTLGGLPWFKVEDRIGMISYLRAHGFTEVES